MATRTVQAAELQQDQTFIMRGSHYRVLSVASTPDHALSIIRSKNARGILTTFCVPHDEMVLTVIAANQEQQIAWARRGRNK